MTRPGIALAVVVLVLFAGITVAKRGGDDPDATAPTADTSAAERNRIRRFWEAYRTATTHRTANRIPEAAEAYATALALDDHHEDALYYSGSMLFELGRFDEAEAAWRRLLAVDPTSARGHTRLGDLYLCHDHRPSFDVAAAEAEYRAAAGINPEETGPFLRLGETALVRGDLREAQTRLEDVLRTNQGSVAGHFMLGYIASRAGRTSDAAEHATTLVDLARARGGGERGLNEGDTEGGAAMLMSGTRCLGVRDLADALSGDDANVTPNVIASLYARADTLLVEARRAMR